MAYNLAYIRQRVLEDKLDDTSYDPDIVDRFINDAQRAIFNKYELPFMEKTFAGTIVGGGYQYVFPDDYQMTQSLKIVDPVENRTDITRNYMRFRRFNEAFPVPSNNSVARPSVWTLHGNRIFFSQPTDQDYVMELYYIKTPDKLEDDADVPEIPEEFEEVLVLGAYYRILERNEDFDLAAYYRNGPYADELDDMVGRLGKRLETGPQVMGQPLRSGGARRSGRS